MGDALYVSQYHTNNQKFSPIELPKASRHIYLRLLKLRANLIARGVPAFLPKRPFRRK